MGREWDWGRVMRRGERESAGCMSGVLQLFDFHQFQCLSQQQQEEQERKPVTKTDLYLLDSTLVKGAEAPRNSLELENEPVTMEEDDIPIGVRIFPRRGEEAAENSNSQGSRTPNLVARLMGLDLLPEDSVTSPNNRRSSPSSAKSRRRPLKYVSLRESSRYESGTRSLPDTPRVSSARRSDADPRLSLQLNKENMDAVELNYFSPCSRKMKRSDARNYHSEENRSPSWYAREIVKQVKESVSRKVGIEITNTHSNTSVCRNKTNLESDGGSGNLRKTKRVPAKAKEDYSTPSCSPRLRFSEPRTKSVASEEHVSNSPRTISKPRILSPPRSPPPPIPVPWKNSSTVCRRQTSPLPKPAVKCKKASNERFTGRLRMPPVSEESLVVPKASLVRKKSKDTSRTRIQSPMSPSQIQPNHRHPQQEVEEQQKQQEQGGDSTKRTPSLPRSSRPTQYEPLPQRLAHRDYNSATTSPSTYSTEEFRYVKGILDRTDVRSRDPLPITSWFSPSHPLDPTLFHLLELHFHHLLHRSHRKLFFHLVDELLVQIVKPYLNVKPWLSGPHNSHRPITGDQLLNCLWTRIRRFPSANCRTLQDIDALVGYDFHDGDIRSRSSDEREGIVLEIEREILDDLVRETAMMSHKRATNSNGVGMMNGGDLLSEAFT